MTQNALESIPIVAMLFSNFTGSVVILVALICVFVIGFAWYAGAKQKLNLVKWRTIKLYSTLAGTFSLVLLLLAFDKTVRDSTGLKNREFANREFRNIRTDLKTRLKSECSEESFSERCPILRQLDDAWDEPEMFVQWAPYSWIYVFALGSENAGATRKRIASIKRALEVAARSDSNIDRYRTRILFCGIFILIFSLAGSVGEAAYQLTQARLQERQTGG